MAQLRGEWLPCSAQQLEEASTVEHLQGGEVEVEEARPSLGEAAAEEVVEAWYCLYYLAV